MESLTAQLRWAGTIEGCRGLGGAAASAYFSTWNGLASGFPDRDLAKVPHHWRHFDRRLSSLTNFRVARTATTPINALLNYAYAIAEAECRMACHALGLDPGLGILHVDRNNRDSLALDLLEAIRPDVDRHVLQMVFERTLRASDFHETRTTELVRQLATIPRAGGRKANRGSAVKVG